MARPRSRWIRTCTLALVVSGGLCGGCQKIFGEYEVAPEPPVTFCVASDKRCDGPLLYTCSPNLDSWVYRESCRSEAHCASREGGCLKCVPGELHCNVGVLEVCGEDGEFSLLEDCGDASRCNLNSGSCRTCTEGEYQCDRENLMQCTQDHAWMVTPCNNEAACSVEPDRMLGQCAEPVCSPKMHVCRGAKLMRCTDSGQQLFEIDNCVAPEVCDAAAADRARANNLPGACVEACEPNRARCVDAEFQLCSADGTWLPMNTCDSPDACSAKLGDAGCEPCTPGSLECNDGVRRCTEAGWELVQDCGAAALCNEAAGKCEAGACPAGETLCDSNGDVQKCIADQTAWRGVEHCAGDLCNANDGDCDPAACVKGAKRCRNNTLEACSPNLRGWDVLEACEAGETCSLEGCDASACEDGSHRCNDIYLETCVGGAWQHADRCATPALCDPTQDLCVPPACALGEYDCVGPSVQSCATNQTHFEELGACKAPEVCDKLAGTCVLP